MYLEVWISIDFFKRKHDLLEYSILPFFFCYVDGSHIPGARHVLVHSHEVDEASRLLHFLHRSADEDLEVIGSNTSQRRIERANDTLTIETFRFFYFAEYR